MTERYNIWALCNVQNNMIKCFASHAGEIVSGVKKKEKEQFNQLHCCLQQV